MVVKMTVASFNIFMFRHKSTQYVSCYGTISCNITKDPLLLLRYVLMATHHFVTYQTTNL